MAEHSSIVVVFDGDCAFCSSCARFLRARVRPLVSVRPWQELDLGALGLTQEACTEAVQCLEVASGEICSGHRAVARALVACRPPWSILGRVIGWSPLAPFAAVVYRVVARNRHRLPGGTPACKITPPS